MARASMRNAAPVLDVAAVRRQFPVLDQSVKGKPLVYLDSAASSQKPECVIDAVARYYRRAHSNVHRGVHTLSERATDEFENAREACRRFLNAKSSAEIVFVRGTTEAINLVAYSYGDAVLKRGDRVVVTGMEHHSNIVPWQMLCRRKDAQLRVAPVTDAGELDVDAYRRLMAEEPAIVALTHVSNALGTVNPVRELVAMAHDAGAAALVDGAQAAPHQVVDVRALDCDFYAFSGHKTYAPTGIGVLYGRQSLLESMPPWQGGGEMIRSVSFERTEYNVLPWKFEAGTPNISGAVGLRAAVEFMEDLSVDAVGAHEAGLLDRAAALAAERPWMRVIGAAPRKAGVLSFDVEGAHPSDVGMILDAEGVAIRAGHHCAMPLMQRYGLAATARASVGAYNTIEDIDALFAAIDKAHRLFR